MPWKGKGRGKTTATDHVTAMRATFLNRTFVKDRDVPSDVAVVALSPRTTGFPEFKLKGKVRGWAEWLVPKGSDSRAPRILYFHGGGYEHLSPPQVRPTTAQLASRSGMPVLCIDYRKIPDHPHPAQLEDASQALQWMSTNGPEGPGRSDALYVAGDSAGGGLALGLAKWLRDYPLVGLRIDGIAVVSPMTDLTCSGESYRTRRWTENGGDERDPLFRGANPAADSMPQIYRLMGKPGAPGSFELTSPYISPLHGALHELPPTLIIVGDAEVMLSDSTDFGEKAAAAGSSVEVKVYPRMWHCFNRFSEGCGTGVVLSQAIDALDQQAEFFKSLARGPAPSKDADLKDLESRLEKHLELDLIRGWEAHLRTCLAAARRPLRQAAKEAHAASEHWHSRKASAAVQRDYFSKIKILFYHLQRAGESDFDGLLREALACLQLQSGALPQGALLAEESAALDRIWKHRFGGVGTYKGLAHERDLRRATQLAEDVRAALRTFKAAAENGSQASAERCAYAKAADALRQEIAVAGEIDFDGLMRQAVRVLEAGLFCKPAAPQVAAAPSEPEKSQVKPPRRWRAKISHEAKQDVQPPEQVAGA